MKINFLKIRNINNLILKLPYEKNYVDLKNNLPIQIVIGNSKIKGYGIVANKDFKKNEVIYIYPMKRYPKNGITIKTKLGERKLDKNIHFDVLFNYFNLCAAFDCFLNHNNNNPNAEHDCNVIIHNKNIYVQLIAIKEIKKGEDIEIDYKTLTIPYIIRKCILDLIGYSYKDSYL